MIAQRQADSFDPGDPSAWIAMGRSIEHAEALAKTWRDFPDLPPAAPLEARMARSRARVDAMRPVNEALRIATEAARQAGNFAYYEGKAADGTIGDDGLAILRGRDSHGYDWDRATCYSQGWYAAHAGWPHRGPDSHRSDPASREAYDRGFADAGGNPSDLFDAARRTNAAALRSSNQPPPAECPVVPRPLPGTWPRPTDAPRPARWSRRLLILAVGPGDTLTPVVGDILAQIRATPGADALTIAILSAKGFAAPGDDDAMNALTPDRCAELADDQALADQLRTLIAGREFDDILVAAEGLALPLVDAVAAALPLCRAMERTGTTLMVHRNHLKLWLERALPDDGNIGAGHIRWGKALARGGLTGKLGEFTVRYDGKGAGGHVLLVEDGDILATGYVSADGAPIDPRVTFRAKARMRKEMTSALRRFAGATRLTARGPAT